MNAYSENSATFHSTFPQLVVTSEETSQPQHLTVLLDVGSGSLPLLASGGVWDHFFGHETENEAFTARSLATVYERPFVFPAGEASSLKTRESWSKSIVSALTSDFKVGQVFGLSEAKPQFVSHSDAIESWESLSRNYVRTNAILNRWIQHDKSLRRQTYYADAQSWIAHEQSIQNDLFSTRAQELRERLRAAIGRAGGIDAGDPAAWDEFNAIAEETHFEDGVETEFARRLVSAIQGDSAKVIMSFKRSIEHGRLFESTIVEALKVFGRADHAPSRTQRLGLLTTFLAAERLPIRDAAAIGLSYLEDSFCLPALQQAIATETDLDLRTFMSQVVHDLMAEEPLESLATDSDKK